MTVFTRDGEHILYIHVPKTGGTSIEELFQRNGFTLHFINHDVGKNSANAVSRCSPQHMCREQMQLIFGLPRFKYIFMTVRNPYARFISEFRMQHDQTTKQVDFNAWAHRIINQYPRSPYMMDNHIRPQSDFYLDRAEIFKQEDKYDDRWIARLSERTGLTFEDPKIRQERVSKNTHTAEIEMSPETRALLRKIYEKDFEQFGYEI